MTNALKEKILKNTTIEYAAPLLDSKIYAKKDMITTNCPMMNAALSGTIHGGLTPGLTTIAGVSRHFKTGFSLLLASSFLAKYPDGVILFYDSEFGTTSKYFQNFSVERGSVIHCPITDIEMLKIDLLQQLMNLGRDDHVLIIVDSVGNLASRKEVEDTLNKKTVADMTRAKQLKSLYRMVTPHLTIRDIPLIVINHTYKEMGLFPKDVVSGGTGGFYSSDTVWIIGRRQDKDEKTKEIGGYHFIINVEKSRYVREKAQVPISVTYEQGVNRWSGLLEIAVEGGYITQPSKGWYTCKGVEKKFRFEDIASDEGFWTSILSKTDLPSFIEKKFALGVQ